MTLFGSRPDPGAPLRPPTAPAERGHTAVCPHCWMVNPGPFRLCSRCGASMETLLQESGGLQRTAPVQSPMPVGNGPGLSGFQRVVVAFFLAFLALGYLAHLVPLPAAAGTAESPVPARSGR